MRHKITGEENRSAFLASFILPLLHFVFYLSIPLWSLLKTITSPSDTVIVIRNAWDAICLSVPAQISKSVARKRPRHVAIVLSDSQARQGDQNLAKLLTWLAMARVENVAVYDEGGSLLKGRFGGHQSVSTSTSLHPMTCQILGPNDGKEALVRAARHIVCGALQRQEAENRGGEMGARNSNGSSTNLKPDMKPDVEPDVEPDIEPDTKPDTNPDIKLDSEPNVKPESEKKARRRRKHQPSQTSEIASEKIEDCGERWTEEIRGVENGGHSAGLASDSDCERGWEDGVGDGAREGGVEGWGVLSEADVDDSLTETGRHFLEPELLLAFGPSLSLFGFPPWQTRLCEIMYMGELRKLKLRKFVWALWQYSRTNQRLGK